MAPAVHSSGGEQQVEGQPQLRAAGAGSWGQGAQERWSGAGPGHWLWRRNTQSSPWLPSVLWEREGPGCLHGGPRSEATAVCPPRGETAAEGRGDGSLVGYMPGLRYASPTVQAGEAWKQQARCHGRSPEGHHTGHPRASGRGVSLVPPGLDPV